MYRSEIVPENTGKVLKVRLYEDRNQLTCAKVYQLWQTNEAFRDMYIDMLSGVPFAAFRWETPPVTAETAQQGFEFVVVESRYLSQSANPGAFREHFQGHQQEGVVVFPNLGKDAVMVVPTPGDEIDMYAHLGSFLRGAPSAQVHALWITVGQAMKDGLSARQIWLNTAGGGVPWLHVRLDSYPKYYVYRPYREML